MRQNGVRSPVRFPYSQGMKKGGKVKKQGYKDREDESIRCNENGKEKSTKKQLRASVEMSLMENLVLQLKNLEK